jgi:hypothetical protein
MRELWEFVLSFEDGSLPAEAWNGRTVAAVAVWYMAMLPVDEAVARLEVSIQRNRHRFRRRTDSAHQAASDMTSLWPRILQHVLTAASARDPLPLANRLMRDGGTVLASRVA